MRRLPPWIVAVLVAISALLILVGWDDRHEAGYLPFALGIGWALFTLASLGGILSQDD
ncbi:MAG: hypothetical protein AB1416_01165 [Actinomycetota bacterium]